MENNVAVEIDPDVFNPVYLPYLDDMARTQIYYGGSASGKSVFLAQRVVYDLLGGGRNYLITRKVGRTIRHSVFAEIRKVIDDWAVKTLFQVNETDLTITCANGYQALCSGLDDVEKLKSLTPQKGVITNIWCEEATELEKNDLKQLQKRQRGGREDTPKVLELSFNPILKTHFLYDEYFSKIGWADKQTEYKGDGLTILKTTYRDNKFLTEADREDLQNETDPYYFNVYSEGNWGILGHVIFTNWRVEDLSNMQAQFTNRRNGLDFGYASDPAALWRSHYDRMRKTIYLFDELYETGLTNPQLAEAIKPKVGSDRVKCDSAEPKSIQELNDDKDNPIDAIGAAKGKDSVNFGIQWMQQQTIVIGSNCINAQNEISTYHWKEDAGGNAMPVPVDKNNHLIDAGRYAHEEDMENSWIMAGDRY
jgi:phage terminase large subunit